MFVIPVKVIVVNFIVLYNLYAIAINDKLFQLYLQREHSLSILKSVFPSVKKSLRREVPVFCSTGQKPHMVS